MQFSPASLHFLSLTSPKYSPQLPDLKYLQSMFILKMSDLVSRTKSSR
jgi:hypothetical protein